MTPPTCDAAWLAAQRWYGASHRRVRSLRVADVETVADGLSWQVLEVHFEADADAEAGGDGVDGDGVDGGERGYYQLFWDERAGRDAAERPEAMGWLFPELFGRDGPADAELLGGEQSNTSVVVRSGVATGPGIAPGIVPGIVKVLRRLSSEPNPDAEVVRRLWEGGFRGIPEPLGERRRRIDVESTPAGAGLRGDGVDLAVARRFLAGSTDGWRLAVEAGAGFTTASRELGALTAELHLALAEVLGVQDAEGAVTADAMAAHARRVLGDAAPAAAFEALAGSGTAPAIRAHGDYHLGQVLRSEDRWYVLDFEGEPARPMVERLAPASPLRDVAGMLRSFAYAAAVGRHPTDWEAACRAAFLDAYLATPGISGVLPADPRPVLDAYELDKAIYEVAYERAHRPEWVPIPEAAVARLVGAPPPAG